METLKIEELKIARSSFRGNPKFGRTSQLIHKATGQVVFEGMGGDWSKMELFSGYVNQEATKARLLADFAAAR